MALKARNGEWWSESVDLSMGDTHNVPAAQTHRARAGGWWWGRAEEGWAPVITYVQSFAVDAFDIAKVFRERGKAQLRPKQWIEVHVINS